MTESGIPTFKMFMTYKKEGVMSDDETMLKVFECAKKVNGLPMVHCESNAIAETNIEKCKAINDMSWVNFAKCKPVLCEAEAFDRAVNFAEYVGNALLVVHTTNEKALNTARRVHEQGLPIYVETGPHYLTLFEDLYKNENGHLAICSPPLRTSKEAEALWKGLQDGTLGFKQVATFTSYPQLGPITLNDERTEETFTVFDHPTIRIYKNLNK